MPSAVPAGVYGRRVPAGGIPIPAAVDPSAAFRITMAAIDPSAEPELDEENTVPRAVLKIIRIPFDLDEDDEDYDEDEEDDDYDSDDIEALAARLREGGALPELESDMSEDDESETEKNGGPSDPAKSKKAKQEALSKKIQEELDAEEMELDHLTNGVNGKGKAKATAEDSDEEEDEDENEDDFDEDEPEEFVLCTLDPEKHYQQPLDITVREEEEVYLVVEGTHDVFVTGNYVAFPMDDEDDDHHHGLDELDYDLSPDEDELDIEEISEDEDDELDGLEDPRITELDSDEEEAPKLVTSKKGKKRPADSDDEATTLDELINKTKAEVANGEKLSKKQAKKLKKNDGQAVATAPEPSKKEDKKKVQFAKNLEQGPTGSPKVEEKKETKKETPKQRTVSGVTIEDKKEGKGRAAKKGDRIEMRYIGKLKNGKQFDANKKGKPFSFKLGVGEVIKGWDIGVAGMMPGSERRLVIPSGLAYGKKALPDIPANSDLVFDIKCISVS